MSKRNWQPPPHVLALGLVWRQKQIVIIFTLSAVLTALLLTYVYSEKYEAGTMVQYRQTEITLLKEMGTQSFGSEAPAAPFKVVSQTIDDLVHSWALLGPIVDELNLTADTREYSGNWLMKTLRKTKDDAKDLVLETWAYLKYGRDIQPDPRAKAIEKLSENVKLINQDSYIFTIVVRDQDPRRAAAIADLIAEQLVIAVRAQSIAAGTAKREQIEGLMLVKDRELRERQGLIDDFMRENRLVSIDDEITEGTERASEVEQQRIVLESELAAKVHRLEAINTRLDSRTGASLSPGDRQGLTTERLETEISINGLRGQISSLQTNLNELQERLRQLPSLDLRLQAMQIELDGTKRDWVQLRDGLQEAIVRENQVASEIQILHRAGVPTAPVSPIKIYHIGLAGFVGLLASVALIFVLDFFNIRVLFVSLGVAGRRPPPTDPAAQVAASPGTQLSES